MIKCLRATCLLSAVLCFSAGASAADKVLSIKAKESTAELEPRDAAQHQVRLPALDIAVVASIRCPDGSKALSLTVSVSDTQQTYGSELVGNAVSLEATFSVSAKQLAPISIPEFCIVGEPTDARGLQLPGIATAQASLRCKDENDTVSMHFGSATVPVRLYCLADGDPAASSSLAK